MGALNYNNLFVALQLRSLAEATAAVVYIYEQNFKRYHRPVPAASACLVVEFHAPQGMLIEVVGLPRKQNLLTDD